MSYMRIICVMNKFHRIPDDTEPGDIIAVLRPPRDGRNHAHTDNGWASLGELEGAVVHYKLIAAEDIFDGAYQRKSDGK
jgi:hypothetical protein